MKPRGNFAAPKKVIRCVGMGTGQPCGAEGQYLAFYSPEAFDGRGDATWTNDPAKALLFEDGVEAFKFYLQIPKNRPRRPDGKPNKPLTAFSVLIEDAPRGRKE